MDCQRCNGLLVSEILWDENLALHVLVLRCINCGECFDSVITNHRLLQAQGINPFYPDSRDLPSGSWKNRRN